MDPNNDDIAELLRLCADSSDDELFSRLESKNIGERAHLVDILAILGELHARRAVLPRSFPSLFVYCTQVLGYCERTAYRRVAVAKESRKFPLILRLLRAGKVHLTAIVLLREHLTQENHAAVLARAEGASMDQLKRMAAALSPVPSLRLKEHE